jgi:Flp pilus assembly pilin Flp
MATGPFSDDHVSMVRREHGQTMTEYSVVLTVIVIVTMVAYIALGDQVATLFQRIAAVV